MIKIFLIIVTLQAQREYPPDMQCKDKFLLQSTIVPPHTDVDELPQDTVRNPSLKLFLLRFFLFLQFLENKLTLYMQYLCV